LTRFYHKKGIFKDIQAPFMALLAVFCALGAFDSICDCGILIENNE
jgi:hypothetical protein